MEDELSTLVGPEGEDWRVPVSELESRLKKRNSETNSSIKIRIEKARDEILLANKFDFIVENDILEKSYEKVLNLINNFINV